MKFQTPHIGLQTVVTVSDKYVQVNTYAGEEKGWFISPPVYRWQVKDIKQAQKKRLQDLGK